MITIYPYQTKEVRDLAWACFSPPLLTMSQVADLEPNITDCQPQLTASRRQWLEQLDRDAGALNEHLANFSSHRLGLYFEGLWQFFLRQDPEFDLVAHNLPVHDAGRTLGEFDCIYFCHRRQRHVHLELAVKFFLGTPASDPADQSWQRWLGPDRADRLDLKMGHMLQRQIRLSEQQAAEEQLQQLGIEHPLQEIALRGHLFQPPASPIRPPLACHPDVRLHHWLHHAEARAYLAQRHEQVFCIAPKMHWLGPMHQPPVDRQLGGEALLDALERYFEQESYPLLITALDQDLTEAGRFFITPDQWP